MGVYNQSTVQIQDNVFVQPGTVPNDTSRIFTISEATLPDFPARVCIHESKPHFQSTLNGHAIDSLATVAQATVDYFVDIGRSVAGAVIVTCEGVENQYELPEVFSSADQVRDYVLREAGQSRG